MNLSVDWKSNVIGTRANDDTSLKRWPQLSRLEAENQEGWRWCEQHYQSILCDWYTSMASGECKLK